MAALSVSLRAIAAVLRPKLGHRDLRAVTVAARSLCLGDSRAESDADARE